MILIFIFIKLLNTNPKFIYAIAPIWCYWGYTFIRKQLIIIQFIEQIIILQLVRKNNKNYLPSPIKKMVRENFLNIHWTLLLFLSNYCYLYVQRSERVRIPFYIKSLYFLLFNYYGYIKKYQNYLKFVTINNSRLSNL